MFAPALSIVLSKISEKHDHEKYLKISLSFLKTILQKPSMLHQIAWFKTKNWPSNCPFKFLLTNQTNITRLKKDSKSRKVWVKEPTEECSLVTAEWMRLNIYDPVSAMRTGLRGKTSLLSPCLRRPGFSCLLRVKRCSLVNRCGRLLGSPDGQSVRSQSGRCRFQLSSLTPPPAVPTWAKKQQK